MRRFFYTLAACAAASAWPAIAQADNKEFSQAVAQALHSSGRLQDYSIGVTTKDDVITLKGRVANKEQMAQAIGMTQSLPGVTRVVNQLEIKPTKKPAANNGAATSPSKAELAAAKFAADAQGAVEEGMTTVRKTIFPDPSLPAQSTTAQADLPSKLKAKRTAVAASKKPNSATEQAYNVRQVAQTAPPSFVPPESSAAMPAPQLSGVPQRMAMAPLAVAGAAAGAAMGACPPGGYPGGPGGMGPGGPGGYGGGPGGGGPLPMGVPAVGGGVAPARYDQPYMPNYAWPSYAAYPNYAAVSYPRQYSPTAFPYIGPFYPYPQVPLGWRKVTLEWDDGWWMLNFKQ